MRPVYFDYNATTPVLPEVFACMIPFLKEQFGNPGSAHAYGQAGAQAVASARSKLASAIGAKPSEIVFTSGGSESNNLALRGLKSPGRRHIITSAIEHPAVTEVCLHLQSEGYTVTTLPVNDDGLVDPNHLHEALRHDTLFVSIMHSNNEVGTLQPIAKLAALVKDVDEQIYFHTDAAQSHGKVPIQVEALGVDLLTLAGHKFYAPKGIGALYVRDGIGLERLIHGAGHESGVRAGTENVAFMSGIAEAARRATDQLESRAVQMRVMRDHLQSDLLAQLPGVRINAGEAMRLPNTLSIGFDGIAADQLVSSLASRVAISAGAACHSGEVSVSATLAAMRVPVNYAKGTIRVSTGIHSTVDEVEFAVVEIKNAVERLRAKQGG